MWRVKMIGKAEPEVAYNTEIEDLADMEVLLK